MITHFLFLQKTRIGFRYIHSVQLQQASHSKSKRRTRSSPLSLLIISALSILLDVSIRRVGVLSGKRKTKVSHTGLRSDKRLAMDEENRHESFTCFREWFLSFFLFAPRLRTLSLLATQILTLLTRMIKVILGLNHVYFEWAFFHCTPALQQSFTSSD